MSSETQVGPALKDRHSTAVRWLLALAGLILGFVVVATLTQRHVPSYHGRSAEAWLRDVFPPGRSAGQQREAIEAFRHMGPEGVEFLIDALQRRESSWSRFKARAYPSLPRFVRSRVSQPIPADTLASAASLALLNVPDPNHESNFPRLVELTTSNHPRTQVHAWGVVSAYVVRYRELKVPKFESEFRSGLESTNHWVRLSAVDVLSRAGLVGSEVIPLLRPALTNGDTTLSNSAQSVIKRLETRPAIER